jgi:hypothetical protein
MEKTTAIRAVLISPKKATFEKMYALDDVNTSKKVRQMFREYIGDKLGDDWQDGVFKS